MLHITKLRKAYEGRTILDMEDLTLPIGTYWIKGENGAGKTTLFRSLSGMIPFEGKVLLNDHFSPTQTPQAYRQKVNYGEAEPLYPEFLTGTELLNMVAEAKGAPEGQIEELCAALGVGDYRHTRIGTYSSGMLKKVSLVMALLGQPDWVFLDEPLITLDPEAQKALLNQVAAGQKKGTSYLLSSHQAWDNEQLPLQGSFTLQEQTLKAI